jgi:hypothetical protein
VQSCSLTEEGAEAIARVAEKAHLKELNLYMNDIGDAGIFKVYRSIGFPLNTFSPALSMPLACSLSKE